MMKQPFFEKKMLEKQINYEDQGSSSLIGERILPLLPKINSQPIVLVCIGTDRSTGDSLGPLVGTLLEEKKLKGFHIYGTLEHPVHAVNLEEKLAFINENHQNPFMISIDACLGRLKSIGSIQIGTGPLKPGAGVNKQLPPVGDMHITGIVNVSGFMEFFVLQNTRLNVVLNMAKTIANGISYANFSHYKKYNWTDLYRQFDQQTTF